MCHLLSGGSCTITHQCSGLYLVLVLLLSVQESNHFIVQLVIHCFERFHAKTIHEQRIRKLPTPSPM